MSAKIGVLLPRSTEYPAMSFDLLDGLRLGLRHGQVDAQLFTQNTGFGEDAELVYGCAEKLVMQDDVDLLIVYATSLNAEALYSFADTTGKPILFLDAGMELFEAPPHPLCRHLTLQGLMANRRLGLRAGKEHPRLLSAVSFLDGGYRGSWVQQQAVEESGGAIVGHFVSQYRSEEFTLAPLAQMARDAGAGAVLASFSSYLDALFMNALRDAWPAGPELPVYCSPFMADEQLLAQIPFPGGQFPTVVPWSQTLEHPANQLFTATIRKEKNKAANLFHVLGWEAAATAGEAIRNGIASLDGWSFEGPRGLLRFHPETHTAYAPQYEGAIEAGEQGECRLSIRGRTDVGPEEHAALHHARPEGQYSRWRNNFFCI